MDYTADNFVHVIHLVMVWSVIVFSYVFYMIEDPISTPESAGFFLQVGFAVLKWTITMAKLWYVLSLMRI